LKNEREKSTNNAWQHGIMKERQLYWENKKEEEEEEKRKNESGK
jgi:hypothetical protein